LGRCQRERAQVDLDTREAAVRQWLEEEPAALDMAARIAAADAAIVTAQARVATIAEALKRLDAHGERLRDVIVCELRGKVEIAARDVAKKLGMALRHAQTLSDELARLEKYDLGADFAAALPRHWHELDRLNESCKLNMWLVGAQAGGWDV
jgi:hypothetical protein